MKRFELIVVVDSTFHKDVVEQDLITALYDFFCETDSEDSEELVKVKCINEIEL